MYLGVTRADVFSKTRQFRGVLIGGVFILLMTSAGQAGSVVSRPAETFGTADRRMAKPARPRPAARSSKLKEGNTGVHQIVLGTIDMARISAEDAERDKHEKSVRFGIGRDAAVDTTAGTWADLPDGGRLWRVEIVSSGALGVRLHFRGVDMPPGAEVSVYKSSDPTTLVGPYRLKGYDDGGEFWTPTLWEDRVRVEYYRPKESGAGGPEFSIDQVQHIYRDPVASALKSGAMKSAGACNNDAACYPDWANIAKATAGIGVINGDSLFCSGTMLDTAISDQTPYWLTAHHCLSTTAEARSAEIYWLYQTPSCHGTPPALSSVPTSSVCRLISTNSTSDYTLLLIEGEIPTGLYWAGWSTQTVANGTAVTGVHHPDGDYKRISFGHTIQSDSTNFVRSGWDSGVTEPGSSGSGLFRDDTQQIVGQLCCGESACGGSTLTDDYGAFAVSYGGLATWLAGGTDDNFEENDSCAAAKTVTAGQYTNLIVKADDEDWYRITVPAGKPMTATLSFKNDWGDIDAELFGACGGTLLDSSNGANDTEKVQYTNSGSDDVDVLLHVFLHSDTRNQYSMTITTGDSSNQPPIPDDCASAMAVGNGTFDGDNLNATTDGTSSCGEGGQKDQWWRYTAPQTGKVMVDTSGSSFDTVLSVYLTCIGPELACDDDSGEFLESQLTFDALQGVSYLIRVAGFRGATGQIQLTIQPAPPGSDSKPNSSQSCAFPPGGLCGVCLIPGGLVVLGLTALMRGRMGRRKSR